MPCSTRKKTRSAVRTSAPRPLDRPVTRDRLETSECEPALSSRDRPPERAPKASCPRNRPIVRQP
ncbi:MAG: hypothetical protein LBP22_13920 [Deltaproteobacteria bacterium]|nr:hypothetical protein [Deltaproteobacteria bacterium]